MPKQTIEINVPADLGLSAIVRTLAHDVFREAGFPEAWCGRLKLVTDELFMNAVRYGSTPGISVVRLRFVLGDGQIEFHIEDDGTGSQKMTPQELAARINQNEQDQGVARTSGRGLATITHLWTDGVTIDKSALGGLRVAFVKKIETTPPPSFPAGAALVPALSLLADAPTFTFQLSGSMDQDNVDAISKTLQKQILEAPTRFNLVLDFKGLDYINSTFIGLLANWYNQAHPKGGVLQIANANASVRDVLTLVGLTKVILLA